MSKISKPKSRLGRGLSSLISVSELPVEGEVDAATSVAQQIAAPIQQIKFDSQQPAGAGGQLEIDIGMVTPNPHQPRRQMNEAALAELAASLKSTGLIQPIIVRRADAGYQLIAGERRLRAAKLAGFTTIPAIVREVDGFTQAQMALVENIQREDLNPIDRALSYRALIEQLGLTQAELAIRLGEDRSSITNFLRLLDLGEPARQLVREGKLSLGHAKILASVTDAIEQERLGNLVVGQELSVRNLERLTLNKAPEPAAPRRLTGSAHLIDLEKSIARQLGMRVHLRTGKKGKGRITIHYGSLDQFDELLTRMNVRAD